MPNRPAEQPSDAYRQLAIAVGALTIVLIDQGVISQADYDRAYAQATHIVDQEAAKQRDQTDKGASD